MNKNDMQIKQDVEEELRWDPTVNAARIGVTVQNGAVALFGRVETYAEKWFAEDAARRVAGVRTIAQDLEVAIREEHRRSDVEIAATVESALRWDVLVPRSVIATVEGGAVALEGEVQWKFQREAAERLVRNLAGVVAVHNYVTVRPPASAKVVKRNIEAALERQATTDSGTIEVTTDGEQITLTGHVSSFRAVEDALAAAWASPGVTAVVNELKVGTPA